MDDYHQSSSEAMDDYPESSSSSAAAKRRRLQVSGDRVGFVLQGWVIEGNEWKDHIIYNIYIVDVINSGDDVFTPLSPTLQIDSGYSSAVFANAFCVVGQTLYMFEGIDQVSVGKSFFRFDLSSLYSTTATTKLRKSDLRKMGDMIYPKDHPEAIATPDGKKIVVFSTHCWTEVPQFTGFEMYDIVEETWAELPPIEPTICYGKKTSVVITSVGFITKTMLLVQVDDSCGGTYVLDLDERRWVKRDFWISFVRANNFFMIDDRFCFTAHMAYDLDGGLKPQGSIYFPRTQLVSSDDVQVEADYYVEADYSVVFLRHDGEKGECQFAQLKTESCFQDHYKNLNSFGLNPDTRKHLIINVLRTDLRSYIDDQKKMQEQVDKEEIQQEGEEDSKKEDSEEEIEEIQQEEGEKEEEDINTRIVRSVKYSLDLKEFYAYRSIHMFSL